MLSASGTSTGSVDLSIVIVNWNVRDLLRRCLQSILVRAIPLAGASGAWQFGLGGQRAFSGEILVIDSASTDDSAYMVRQEFPEVRLFASPTNLGYTGGNNLGMTKSRGRYVLLLNADTELLGDALGTMVAYMNEGPDVGVVGPQLLWPDGNVQSSRRRFPSLCTAFVESTFLQKWFPGHPELRRYQMLDRADGVTGEVDWVTGACMLVRRETFEQVGMLDDSYFMYSEELDWQKRIKAAGWRVVYLHSAKVVHHLGGSSGQVSVLTQERFGRSKVRYFRKHHGRLAGEIVRWWLLANYAYEWAIEGTKWCVGHKRSLRAERMRGYGQVLRSGLRG